MNDNGIRSRPYDPDWDRVRLAEFMYSTTAQCSAYTFGHIGNLMWSMFYNTGVEPTLCARLWEDSDGVLVGLAWLDGGELVIHAHPTLRGTGVLEVQMIGWAEQAQGAKHPDEVAELFTSANADDAPYIALLQRHGFVREGDGGVLLECPLVNPIPDVLLPEGAVVRHVAHPDEYLERVNAHRDAFAPSGFTLEAYQNVRMAPGYDSELDLVAVLPDGTVASYCICWWDAVNRRGLFEPVGTRKAWQRRGFGRAVMLEGLRRLRARGAASAAVGTAAGHTEAIQLYESVGMRIVKHSDSYVKRLGSQR